VLAKVEEVVGFKLAAVDENCCLIDGLSPTGGWAKFRPRPFMLVSLPRAGYPDGVDEGSP
jgi:hypothetical protein